MKTITSIIILILLTNNIFSQNYTVYGTVFDKKTNEKIINATVFEKNTYNASFTDQFGFYSLIIKNAKESKKCIVASYVGYKPDTLEIELTKNTNLNIYLEPSTDIDTITITAQIPSNRTTNVGYIDLPISKFQTLPAIGGETDIMKISQMLPGIQSGNEGSSNIYVRGGSPDQNLIMLDDVPLYYVNHLAGFISVFNANAINSMQIYKGGFPARFGGRLSSVFDIRMRDGNSNSYKKEIALGLVNCKATIEGPLPSKKGSFLITGRYLPWELILKPFLTLVNEGRAFGYNFYDINLKINYHINPKNNIYFSFYSGDDALSFYLSSLFYDNTKMKYSQKWGNMLFALRLNTIASSRLTINNTLAFTRFRYNTLIDYSNKSANTEFNYNFNTGIKDIMLNTLADFNASKFYKLKFGSNLIYHSFNPGITSYSQKESSSAIDTAFGILNIESYEIRLFVENNFEVNKFLKTNIGIHFCDYYVQNKNYLSIQPRFVLNLFITKNISLKTSYSEVMQSVHLLTNNSIGLTPDLWISATKDIEPAISKQLSMGFYSNVARNKYEISIEGYYKTSKNIIIYKEGATFIGNGKNWTDKIEKNGTGKYYGIEFFVFKKTGKTTGWIAYTYSHAYLQFENMNFGKPFAFKYDRRHEINFVVNQQISTNTVISATWVYGSGYPFTMPIAKYNSIDNDFQTDEYQNNDYKNPILIYDQKNSWRMRAYHRLDLAANFTKQLKKGTRTWVLSVYNAYNRQNPYFYYTKIDANTGSLKLYQQSLFTIIPSVSYIYKF